MITEKRYARLKKEVEDARKSADRAQGALDTTIKRLKDEFGCKSVKDAKAKLAELEGKAEAAEKEFDEAFEAYEEKWHADDRE